ncbi:TPA: hypothetical protein EYN65_10995 [Candidatus Poribacteria bacterium]|nr:hypothetical protein [Candidatus Poribacteria bacterium]HIO37686.1 hypothetical protein [Rhodospirillales bacterium]
MDVGLRIGVCVDKRDYPFILNMYLAVENRLEAVIMGDVSGCGGVNTSDLVIVDGNCGKSFAPGPSMIPRLD